MNIRSAHLKRVDDNLVDEFDERRVIVTGFEFAFDSTGRSDVALSQFNDRLIDGPLGGSSSGSGGAVITVQGGLDVLLRRHAQFNFGIEQVRQCVGRIQIRRVRCRHGDFAVSFENGNDAVFFGQMPGYDRNNVIRDFHSGKLDDFRAELRRPGLDNVGRFDCLVGQQQINDAHV